MRVIKALIVVVFLAVTIVFSANYYKEKTATGYPNPGAVFQIPRNRSNY